MPTVLRSSNGSVNRESAESAFNHVLKGMIERRFCGFPVLNDLSLHPDHAESKDRVFVSDDEIPHLYPS